MNVSPEPKEVLYLGLGANLGDRAATLRQALVALGEAGLAPLQVSPLYETAPWGKLDQPPFLNLVAAFETDLPLDAVWERCTGVERALGRVREERWGPRTIDIDLLAFDQLQGQFGDLRLPHPQLHLRAFVLLPWASIAPDFIVPGLGRSVADLCADLPAAERAGVHVHGRVEGF